MITTPLSGNQAETGIRHRRQAGEVVERESQRLGLETRVGASMEEIRQNIDGRSLFLIVPDHEDLSDSLGDGADDDYIVGSESVADDGSHFAEENLRHFRVSHRETVRAYRAM